MRQLDTVCLMFLLLLAAPLIHANDSVEVREVLQSKYLNEQRIVTVKLPQSYSTNSGKVYPVIYILGPMDNMLPGMMRASDAAPEVIIVGIENTDRLRDLTPTVNYDPRGPVGKGGGAEHYLDFIEMELMPYLNKTYRTNEFTIVSGSSIGGLLVLHALQSRPNMFSAYIAFSPAVWWDKITRQKLKAFIAKTASLDKYLYMNIGEEGGDMRADYDDIHRFLHSNKPENFKFVSDAFDDVAHGLTAPAGMFNAYHNLFLSLRMPYIALTDGPKSILNYYEKLSWQYGETVTPPEWAVRQLAYSLMVKKELSGALQLFKFNIQLHPESADAYDGLAYFLQQQGQFNEALKQAKLALSFAKEDNERNEAFIERINTLKSLTIQNDLVQ